MEKQGYAPAAHREAAKAKRLKHELMVLRVIKSALNSIDENDLDRSSSLVLHRLTVAGFKVVKA